MGLAASQARLLTITARKADCEFQSMALSHQKLALSRDMERVSTEYQNALNQTKLVYDYYGSGDKQVDLTYGLFMEPSIYNDYVPKLVTDPTNRVILNSAYAAAARAAGIPAEGLSGLPSSDVRNAFIDALAAGGIITPKRAEAIKGVDYNNAVGLGNGVTATASFKELTFEEFISELASKEYNNMGNNVALGIMFDGKDTGMHVGVDNIGGPFRAGMIDSNGPTETNPDDPEGGISLLSNVTLSDLLSGDTKYYISAQSDNGELTPITGIAALQRELVGDAQNSASFLNWLTDAFSSVLGGVPFNDTAIQYAYNTVYDLLCPNNKLTDFINKYKDPEEMNKDDDHKVKRCDWFKDHESEINEVLENVGTKSPINRNDHDYNMDDAIASSDYIGMYYTQEYDDGGLFHADKWDRSQVAVNLNNLAKAFLTAYVQFQEGLEETDLEVHLGKLDKSNLYTPQKDKDFRFIVAGEVEVDDGDSNLYANFYDALFNRICLNGWTENDKINDKEYMQELLKNGMAFISSMSDDGFYYQGNYATDRTILEVKDDEAIARAQAKYNREKASIEYKEDKIDMKMKNLDTEISSLTTEYDTTKQLITKTVEKSFKRYEA